MKNVKFIIGIIFRLLLIPLIILSIPTGAIISIIFIAVEYIFDFRVGPEKECEICFYLCCWPFIVYEYYEDKYLNNENIH